MISIVCYVIRRDSRFFLAGGETQSIFSQPQPDEVAWGLFFVVLAWLLGGSARWPVAP